MYRLDLGLYSHPKEVCLFVCFFFGGGGGGSGVGVRIHVNSKGKIPSTGSSEENRTRDAASCRTASPKHYRLSYSGPCVGLKWGRYQVETDNKEDKEEEKKKKRRRRRRRGRKK